MRRRPRGGGAEAARASAGAKGRGGLGRVSGEVEAGLELLRDMLAIPSLSGNERDLSGWMIERLSTMGFEPQLDSAGNVVARRGRGRKHVALVGHLDTVPGFIPVRREGDRLFGRGAVDAKGPLAAAITALTMLPAETKAGFTLIGAVDEEGGSRGARHAKAY